jgi:hypothetical protein
LPDTLVGAPISAEDFPASAYAADTTSIADISSTTFIAGSPQVSTTFIAPTSGAVLVSVGLSARDNGGSNAVHLAPEIRETNVSGSVVLSANVVTHGVGCPGEPTTFIYRSRTTLVTGLTPGQLYFARTMHKVSSGSSADLQVRDITICPTPLGSSFAGRPVRALDYPPPQWAQNTTQIDNPSSSSYTAGSPAVSVTFIAPTSGRVLLIVGGGLGNSAGANRIFLSPEVRETDASGDVVLAASVTSRGFGSDNCAGRFVYGSRESVLEGLTPGQQYFARVMYVVLNDGGGNTADIAARDIGVVPIP